MKTVFGFVFFVMCLQVGLFGCVIHNVKPNANKDLAKTLSSLGVNSQGSQTDNSVVACEDTENYGGNFTKTAKVARANAGLMILEQSQKSITRKSTPSGMIMSTAITGQMFGNSFVVKYGERWVCVKQKTQRVVVEK